MKLLYLATILGLMLGANVKTTIFKTVDATGAPFPNVLIIVKSLEGEGEMARYLTGPDGRTPTIRLSSGLYRVIATCPYGLCRTTVREFLGSDMPSEIVIPVSVNPTDLNGEIVGGTPVRLLLEVPHGKASGAHILVRDPEAHWEKWYVADKGGIVQIELPSNPSTVVVIYNGKIFIREVSASTTNHKQTVKTQNKQLAKPTRTVILHLNEDQL